jgi:hypothetical protein
MGAKNRKEIQHEIEKLRNDIEVEARLDAQKTKQMLCRIVDLVDWVFNEK